MVAARAGKMIPSTWISLDTVYTHIDFSCYAQTIQSRTKEVICFSEPKDYIGSNKSRNINVFFYYVQSIVLGAGGIMWSVKSSESKV